MLTVSTILEELVLQLSEDDNLTYLTTFALGNVGPSICSVVAAAAGKIVHAGFDGYQEVADGGGAVKLSLARQNLPEEH